MHKPPSPQNSILPSELGPTVKSKLLKAGFVTLQDVIETSPLKLAQELRLSNAEALEIVQTVKQLISSASTSASITPKSQSALDLLQSESSRRPLTTLCQGMDDMLGGGIPIAKVIEFCGAPGIGKTQLGIQLAVNVQLSEMDGEAVYIDTEGSFIVERVIEIIEGTKPRFGAPKVEVDTALSRIHHFRVHDYIEEIALLNILDDFIRAHPRVKLVVIDSIAFHFRYDFSDIALRTRLLNGMAQQLMKLAEEFQLAVVLMNQMTTKIQSTGEAFQDQSILTPALGESWGHACTNRVILFWQGGERHAQLFKSPSNKEQVVRYRIGKEGLQDLPAAEEPPGAKRKWPHPHSAEKAKRN